MTRMLFAVVVSSSFWPVALWGGEEGKEETVSYLKPSGKKFVPEARFTVRQGKYGWSIASSTGGGEREMGVRAKYDAADRLQSAAATLTMEDYKAVALVECKDGKAAVHPKDRPVATFPVVAGMIVTSAPDWTDAFLLCRRYDRAKGGKQKFVGLWVHPKEQALLLDLTIEAEGKDVVRRNGEDVELTRCRIVLRGPQAYVAWMDKEGGLIKLVSASPKGGSALIRDGWETVWEQLRAK
ncbi:MAG: hypothetical protein U0793_13225 [Gemmataceae bacterium]